MSEPLAKDENREALDALLPLLYGEMRKLAAHYLRGERLEHTLQPTALVHEAYLRLADQQACQWQNRAHVFAVAAQVMRNVLVDHARAGKRAKRGGGALRVSLRDSLAAPDDPGIDLLLLHDALKTLEALDPRAGRIVELRYFAGLSVEETADLLDLSPATVKRNWTTAKAWLRREMERGA